MFIIIGTTLNKIQFISRIVNSVLQKLQFSNLFEFENIYEI